MYRGLLDGVQPVAIKIIPAALLPCGSARRASADSLREVALLRQCRCPHIVQARPTLTLVLKHIRHGISGNEACARTPTVRGW